MKADRNFENIDAKLASSSQKAIQQVVESLPEDTLSMAWRSSLNERLIAESAAYKPRLRFSWFAAPAAGLAVAAVLAVAVFVHPPTTPNTLVKGDSRVVASAGSVEIGLLDTYRQESVSHEIVGSGPDPSAEVSHPSIADVATDSDGSEVDPESL